MADKEIKVVAGDDLTLKCNFFNSNDPGATVFHTGDRTKMVISGITPKIEIYGMTEDSVAYFYLSCENTEKLAAAIHPLICVHILWASGGRSTPIVNKKLVVERCHPDD